MKTVNLPKNMTNFSIHCVGIKGTGMTALVEICKARGALVCGSDVPDVFYTDAILEKLKIPVFTTFDAKNLDSKTKLVIYSSAYKRDENPELIAADAQGIPVLLYSEALGLISKNPYSCGIAGVHGKTTTTALVGTLVKAIQFPAQVLAGSVVSSFGDTCTLNLGQDYFIAETCEYQKHFMSFCPKKIILTSIESDHQDYYPTYESILSAFIQYLDLLPEFGEVFYCADDIGACDAVKTLFNARPDIVYTPYGEAAEGDYKLTISGVRNERLVFALAGFSGEFRLRVSGHHNAKNATAAFALMISLLKHKNGTVTKSDISLLRDALLSFTGSKRRCEIVGEVSNILFIDDYAHHPTAIKTTLAGLKEFYPNRKLIVDFMSHTYSRTASLLNEFAESFSDADEVILHKIYASAREKYTGTITGETLYKKTASKHNNVMYFEEILDAADYVASHLKKGDIFITMGAGDNWKLGKEVIKKLERI